MDDFNETFVRCTMAQAMIAEAQGRTEDANRLFDQAMKVADRNGL